MSPKDFFETTEKVRKEYSKLIKAVEYDADFQKDRSLPEEKRTTSEQTLNKLKSDLDVYLTEAEWSSLTGNLNNSASIDAFKKKIILQ